MKPKNKSKGLIFEQAIVSGVSEDTNKVPQSDVDNARSLLEKAGVDLKELPEQKLKFSEKGDPKTDIYYKKNNEEFKISVKYKSGVQLCSVNKNTVAKYFNVASEKSNTKSERVNNLIKSFDNLPKDVSEEEYNKWASKNRELLNEEMNTVLSSNPMLKESLANVALTGQGLFKDNRAVANYILTENKLIKIDKGYIAQCAKKMKPDFRSKSRRNKKTNISLSEANFRIDLDMKHIDGEGSLS